jgi:hypothetical protein
MVAIPPKASPTLDAIYASYERTNERPRGYLGASIIGNECARALWYGFRWCSSKQFDGRMMRLFQTGHLQEPRMVEDLRNVGVKVWATNPATGKQWSFSEESLGHHYAGNCDGIAQGVHEAPVAAHVLEFKTHSAKSFSDLIAKGVRASKPTHFAQMQQYMDWSIKEFGSDAGCYRALYMAVNKDTDELYLERIEFDAGFVKGLLQKAETIIFAPTPLPRIKDDPSWYACKWCDQHDICHGEALPIVSCRTCVHATPERDGNARWTCGLLNEDISLDVQRNGCEHHRYIPPLLENVAEAVSCANGVDVTYRRKSDGHQFVNGDPGYASSEIRHGLKLIGDGFVEDIRERFNAKIDGATA